MNTQKQIFLIVALVFIFVGGCAAYSVVDIPTRAPDQAKWQKSQSIERGALLYANNCRTCHGLQGEGGAGLPLNHAVNSEARNFQDQDPLVLKSNIAFLQRTLTCGRAGTLMPAWLNTNGGSLNVRQIEHLIDFLTAPVEEKYAMEDGTESTEGWHYAEEFAHNLNHETAVGVGGDTLGTISSAHNVGIDLMLKANSGLQPDQVIEKGSKIQLPANKLFPEGRTYVVRKDRETLTKIADAESVGAMAIADLNNIGYKFNEKLQQLTLLGADGQPIFGLFVHQEIKLPSGSTYILKPADTFDKIAAIHNVSASELRTLNPNLETTTDGSALVAERRIALPANAVVVVQPAQTLTTIATAHLLKPEDLLTANGLTADAVLTEGQRLKLPSNTRYVVQPGDTIASIAAAHGIAPVDLASQNNLQVNAAISPAVVIRLPQVDRYVVQGQTLEDIAKTFSNVTAESLGTANNVPANALLQIGQPLVLPADAWGSAPPDAKNPGTACIEHAVPDSVFKTITGEATPAAAVTPPATASNNVTIEAGANDWHVIADGTTSQPNSGVVLVNKGTSITFTSKTGLHTVTTEKGAAPPRVVLEPNLRQGATVSFPFNETGTFSILCDFHPAMFATVFVQ